MKLTTTIANSSINLAPTVQANFDEFNRIDPYSCTLGNAVVSTKSLGDMVKAMKEKCVHLLRPLIPENTKTLYSKGLRDLGRNVDPGISFLDLDINSAHFPSLEEVTNWVSSILVNDGVNQSLDNISEQTLNPAKVLLKERMKKTLEIQQILLVLIHLTGGMPPRGTEIPTILIRNQVHTKRHIFWSHQTLAFAPSYTKTRSITGKDGSAIRFVPHCVTELILQYLVWVRPLEM